MSAARVTLWLRDCLPAPARRMVLTARDRLRLRRAERAVARFSQPPRAPHDLSTELVVSLTSYPPRFRTLAKTLRSLLLQTIKADRTVLWVTDGNRTALPGDVLRLQEYGLEIRSCDDIRSYKKIVPALLSFPQSHIVTADDDLYYEPDWLRTLVRGSVQDKSVIVCRRAHRPRFAGGAFAPYISWQHDVVTDGTIEDCLFPTTGAGALFPPGSLAPEVVERKYFESLCPDADDIWMFVMALRAGSRFRQVGPGFAQVCWDGSQEVSLLQGNVSGGNDRQLAAVIKHFGNPL